MNDEAFMDINGAIYEHLCSKTKKILTRNEVRRRKIYLPKGVLAPQCIPIRRASVAKLIANNGERGKSDVESLFLQNKCLYLQYLTGEKSRGRMGMFYSMWRALYTPRENICGTIKNIY